MNTQPLAQNNTSTLTPKLITQISTHYKLDPKIVEQHLIIVRAILKDAGQGHLFGPWLSIFVGMMAGER